MSGAMRTPVRPGTSYSMTGRSAASAIATTWR
ncbi:Uncharacterised protein [Mycobacteroides abscessus]|nr:Uncharacterised protein [Mycobacteroides abscessus]